MRDIHSWHKGLSAQLRPWPADACMGASTMCQVELGFGLLEELAPHQRAMALWSLLMGYPIALSQHSAADWSTSQKRAWNNARHLLASWRSQVQWLQTWQNYRSLPEHLRGYEVEEDGRFARKAVSICPNRYEIYQQTLHRSVPHRVKPLKWAEAGEHTFIAYGHFDSVNIPPELVLPRPPQHKLQKASSKIPLSVSWAELIATACWMDEEEEHQTLPFASRGQWQQRLARVQLEVWGEGNEAVSDGFTIKDLTHVIGMVSSGKSTMMDVLSVWMARRGLHVTLVVGDVMSALNRAQMFVRLGIKAAPILGSSNRKQHIEKLHRSLAGRRERTDLQTSFDHMGFRWLSTTCPLDGVRSENNLQKARQPLGLEVHPCTSLHPCQHHEENSVAGTAGYNEVDYQTQVSVKGNDEEKRRLLPDEYKACPLYAGCPFHQAQRDLVDASIWIATPASLVYTRVASQLDANQMRFAEMVYQRSDLIIVDEADQVQVQLDAIFNPSQTLVGRNGWINRLQERVVTQLNNGGRSALAEEGVGPWLQGHDAVATAVNRLYAILLQHPDLCRWVEDNNYFTDWILLQRIARTLSSISGEVNGYHEDQERYSHLSARFERYIDDPLGNENEDDLCELTRLALSSTQAPLVRERLASWIEENKSSHTDLSSAEVNREIGRLELALLVAVLQNRINHLIRHWGAVETTLGLQGGASLLSHDPPEDYLAVLPEPPMGQVPGLSIYPERQYGWVK